MKITDLRIPMPTKHQQRTKTGACVWLRKVLNSITQLNWEENNCHDSAIFAVSPSGTEPMGPVEVDRICDAITGIFGHPDRLYKSRIGGELDNWYIGLDVDGLNFPIERAKTWKFEVDHPGERAAGIWSFEDTVKVTVESGDPGGEPGEFEKDVRAFLLEWFDGAGVSEGEPVNN